MIITKISPQVKNENRVNIFVDNEFYCGIDTYLLIDLGIKKGDLLTDNLKEILLKSNNIAKCNKKALALLSYRDRTSFELKKRLLEADFDIETINVTIEKLTKLGFINDNLFLDNYIKSKIQTTSKIKIMQNLVILGLPKKIIEEKLNENVSEEDELSSIEQILQKKIQSLSGDNITKKQKVIRYLIGKGFKYNSISKVVSDHFPSDD